MTNLPQPFDPHAAVFPISIAGELAGMPPQPLRGYDRLGLVVPKRARGRGRRYSLHDIAKLRHIQQLSQEEGINLEGIRRILALEDEVDALRGQIDRLAETLQRVQDTGMTRLFTADIHGGIHTGGYRATPLRELDWP